jgi:excisionase family DNA binding protein
MHQRIRRYDLGDQERIQNQERFLSLREAAAFLAVSPGFLYKWIHEIPHCKIGGPKSGKLLFKPSELAAWVEKRREPTNASA